MLQARANFTPSWICTCLSVGLVTGLVPHLLGGRWSTIIGVSLIVTALAFLSANPNGVLLAVPLASSASVLILVLAQRSVGTVRLDGTIVALFVIAIALVFVFVRTGSMSERDQCRQRDWFPYLTIVLVLGVLNRSVRSWTDEEAFGILVSNGEDNAAWLVALSRSVVAGQTTLTNESGVSGGPGTGFFVAFWREVMSWLDPSDVDSNASNGLVLVRSYPLIATMCAVLVVLVAMAKCREMSSGVKAVMAVVVGVISYSTIMGFATVGHFSAAVAVLFLIVAVAIAEASPYSGMNRVSLVLREGAILSSLVAAGQSWFPLTFLAVLYAILRAFGAFRARFLRIDKACQRYLVLIVGVVSAAVLIALARLTFPSFFGNVTDLSYITKNLTIPGGYSTFAPWVYVVSVSLPLFFLTQRNSAHGKILVLVLSVPPTALFLWSYFLPPYTPQYGAWKYLYVGASSLLPLAVTVVVRAVHESGGNKRALAALVTAVLFFSIYSPPLSYANWANSVGGSRYDWVDPIVRELRNNPSRPVGCLNTIKDDQTQNYMGYLCSRMAFGLGGFDEVRHRVWTAANLCTVSPEQMKSEWPVKEQSNLTVIVFDGARGSSGAGCQVGKPPFSKGIATYIDYGVVRVLDSKGNEAQIVDR